jgi:hypothetical protein
MTRSRKWLIAVLAAGFACLQSGLAFAVPEVGWWWNASESGRGFFIEMKGTQLFVAGYFYADDGRATWAVSGGAVTDLNNYSGRLLTVNGGQTLLGPYKAPAGSADIGALTLHFTDATHGTLTWPGGTIQIVRQPFGSGDASFQPSGWWWSAAESGRGFSIEVQGTTMDVVGFMYDGNGNPVWYISSGPMSSPTHYVGHLDQIGGGQTMSGPYKAPTTVTPVGFIGIDFASLASGTITLSDAALKALVTIPITPQLENPPLTSLAANWGGTYSGTLINDPPGADTLTVTATGDVTWIDAAKVPNSSVAFPATATPNRSYLISGGTATINVTGTATLPVLGQSAVCTLVGSVPVSLLTTFGNSYLLFEANGTVTGQIATKTPILFPVTATCITPLGGAVISSTYPVDVNVPIHGRHRYNHSEGTDPIHTIAPNVSAGATWSFTGVPGT